MDDFDSSEAAIIENKLSSQEEEVRAQLQRIVPYHRSQAAAVKQLVLHQIDKKLKDLRTLKQHYYPEGGWGWVILVVSLSVQCLVWGTQMALAMDLNLVATASTSSSAGGVSKARVQARRLVYGVQANAASWLGALSISMSLLISPLTVAICRRKSTRLTAVMGGLVTALGCLFTSFASQFHQLFLSYGIMLGIGVAMTRDPATLMLGQYFKRRRDLVEILLVSGSGLGLAVINKGWRVGLQIVTGVVFMTFLLGMFYRSASLYHPQRRAILHLKSQKRKIKNKDKEKNKAQDDRPPYFDFTTLRSRTVQILLLSISVASIGIYAPIMYLSQQASIAGSDGLLLQVYLGCGWVLGCFLFGFLVLFRSKDCRISKQYLCQVSLMLMGASLFAFTAVQDTGFVLFVWAYGLFCGGYHYSLKMYIYEKVRARNFPRAWGFAQFAMALPNLFGVPAAGYINFAHGPRSGYYLSATAVVLGSLLMFLIDVHKHQLRQRHKKHRRQHSRKSIAESGSLAMHMALSPRNSHSQHEQHSTASVRSHSQAQSSSHHSQQPQLDLGELHCPSGRGTPRPARREFEFERKLSFSEQDEFLPPVGLLSHQRSFTYDDIIDTMKHKPELTVFSEEEGIADMDLPDHLFMDELEFLDNITSCNKVENCLMLSEYEQNLIKETESPPAEHGLSRRRKWSSLFRQPSQILSGVVAEPIPEHPARVTIGVGGFRQTSFSGIPKAPVSAGAKREIPLFPNTAWRLHHASGPPKRSITVIEEASV